MSEFNFMETMVKKINFRTLLHIGNWILSAHPDLGDDIMQIPEQYVFENDNINELIDWCYSELQYQQIIAENNMIKGILNSTK